MTCPACSASVPEGAATCPACDHELDRVGMGGPDDRAGTEGLDDVLVGGSDPQPDRAPARPSWLVFGGVAAAVLGVGAIAFAFFAGSPLGGAAYADRMPADAAAYVEVDVEWLLSDDTRNLLEAFGPAVEAATGEPLDADAIVDEALASFEGELVDTDLSFSEDIASWATGPVAVGVYPGDAEGGEQMALVVGGDDEDALDDLLDGIASSPDAGVSGTTQIAGVEFLVVDSEDDRLLVGRSGTDLVAASNDTIAETLVTGSGDTLDADASFNARLGELPADPAMLFAVDGDVITEQMSASEELGAMGVPGAGMGLLGGQVPPGWMAGAVVLSADEIRVEYVGATSDDIPTPTFDDELTAAFPGETVAFFRVGTLVQQLAAVFDTGMMSAMDDDLEAGAGFGIADVASVFSVDGAIAMWPSSEPELPVNAALVGVSDEEQSALVDRLAELAPSMGFEATPTDHGYSLAGLVHLGTRGTSTFLSTDEDLVAGPPEESFADGDLAARAGELVDGELQMALDMPAVIDLVDGLVAADDPEAADVLACLPLGVAASGIEVTDETMTSSFVIEIVSSDC